MSSQNRELNVASVVAPTVALIVLVSALSLAVSLIAPSANATSLGPTNGQRRALAGAEARHLLTLATLPAGSTKLSRWIAADGKALLTISPAGDDPDATDLTEYFLAPHGKTAQRWLDDQTPLGGTVEGSGSSAGPGSDDVTYKSFSFASSTSILVPLLQYSTLITPSGELGLRVDADVTWTPRKSSYSIIAPGATKVVVIAKRGLNTAKDAVTSTTTKVSVINAIISHVNQLPAKEPGAEFCPLDDGATMTLQFFNAGASLPYAVVTAEPTGCGNVKILQYGANATLLGMTNVAGGSTIAAYVAHQLHIKNWTGASTN